MKALRTTRTAAIGVIVALLAPACSNSPSSSAGSSETGPLKVGAVFPLSGPAGPNGQRVVNAIRAVADELNAKGGVRGRKIELIVKDDQSKPALGVSAANDLVGQRVSAVFQGWNSPVTLASQPVYARAKIMNITVISQASNVLGGADKHAVRLNAGNAFGAQVASDYFAKKLKPKSVAYLTEDDAYGTDAQALMEAELKKKAPSARNIASEKFPFTATDFRVALTNVKAKNPDAVFAVNASESSGMPALIKQYKQFGVKAPFFAGLGTVAPSVIKLAGPAAEGIYSADMYFADQAPFKDYPENQKFIESFKKRSGGEPPDKYSALGGQGVLVWARAVEKAGGTDQAAVAGAIQGQRFTDTILGDVTFTPEGQMEPHMYVFTVRGGRIQLVQN